MSQTTTVPEAFDRFKKQWKVFAFYGAAVGVLIVGAIVTRHQLAKTMVANKADSESPSAAENDNDESREVRLPKEKIAAAGLAEAATELRPVRESRTVPASIIYDATKHLELTSPVDCVVRDVLVEPGKPIQVGTKLAILTSSEVGLARNEVLRRDADLALAKQELTWAEDISTNVGLALGAFDNQPAVAEVERSLKGKPLGELREKLLGGYSKFFLAQTVLGESDSLEEKGALSRRTIDERRSAKEVAAASFQAACDVARMEAKRNRERALAEFQQAERLLKISRERLATLLGPQGEVAEEGEHVLSDFVVTAPFAGRLQERYVVAASRVTAGKPLFSIADTSSLWVEAEIHERDWRALDVAESGTIQMRVPALENREFQPRVRFLGTHVSSDTRSVPLIAELPNTDGKLRPGMFVWVDVPLESERMSLVVPSGAIMRHENHPFVFVPIDGETFRRVDVRTGLETRDGVEILSGLEAGQRVVASGAFFLKSELLLEREVE